MIVFRGFRMEKKRGVCWWWEEEEEEEVAGWWMQSKVRSGYRREI